MTSTPRCRPKLWFLAAALVGVVGCGGPTLYQVNGTVAYKDESDIAVLAGGLVQFEPSDPEVKVSVRGQIQPDGTFRMSTFRDGDGVMPGKYRIMVSPPVFRGRRTDPRPELLDERFQAFDTSGLDITVTGAVADLEITVEKPR